ncbi:hypothetical protein H6G33_10450 [Calothrix sp. FACHB-1219]|uniref:hypothetical protein n=1 Tax=unclassified Calothrix TaxID=2619626 RepID=UPI0016835E1B|nr:MULTISPECIES: hypothetical protein [unclassified Calothrix]MBD2201767.1 hypothetical protein [Calothrix sp. FACHB-168]MBD2217453.1 hypothetical protein [Calothrix sp. FACHB-1219]
MGKHKKGRWSRDSSDYEYDEWAKKGTWISCNYNEKGERISFEEYDDDNEESNREKSSSFLKVLLGTFNIFRVFSPAKSSKGEITYSYSTAGDDGDSCMEYLDVPLSNNPSEEEIEQSKRDKRFKERWSLWHLMTFRSKHEIVADNMDYYDLLADEKELEETSDISYLVDKIISDEKLTQEELDKVNPFYEEEGLYNDDYLYED